MGIMGSKPKPQAAPSAPHASEALAVKTLPARDADILRVAGALLGAMWVSMPFKQGPQWEARCDLALDEAERLIRAYDERRRR